MGEGKKRIEFSIYVSFHCFSFIVFFGSTISKCMVMSYSSSHFITIKEGKCRFIPVDLITGKGNLIN